MSAILPFTSTKKSAWRSLIQPVQINRKEGSYLLKLNDVCEKLGLSRNGLAKLAAKDPTFPKPIKLGDTRQSPVHYVASEITAWLEAKKAARAA